ncbi:MAG: type II toxin-antitoxin system RelE/ParE family toxin [Nitrospira sp.]|nr:type II toxin-antitoxin system RelE/ParE family toxin [Nitrospira sp.]MDE0504617.1 type II toxin-antitoxin system RelE/ParE family toxin [Candidatus Poribacteria bacterium]
MKLIVDLEAFLELRNATAFYEDSQPGLGKAFLASVEAATEEIVQHPLRWRKIKGKFRRYLIHGFPYGLIYAVQDDAIYVAAVMHLKRKPGYWVRRAKKTTS